MYRLQNRLHRWAPLTAVLLVLAACGGDASADADTGDADAPEAATTANATAEAPADIITDVREITFAPELEVDLDQMDLHESGLYVQVLEDGSGPPAGTGDQMGVHYTVWLPNGFKVDSSVDRGDPLPMVLGQTQLIPGWIEGVTGMRLGERRKLVLPYDLAYGERGRAPIPPYSPLVFIVELAEHTPTGEG